MARLEGKVALITGAASVLGEGAAMRFSEEGACVVVADIQEDKGRALGVFRPAGARQVIVQTSPFGIADATLSV